MREYIALLKELVKDFEEMIAVAQKKFQAASDGNIILLEECMKSEQASTLKLRGLEKKRIEIQKAAGMDELTLTQVVEQASAEYEDELQLLYPKVQDVVKRFQESNEAAKDALSLGLHRFDRIVEQLKTAQDSTAPPTTIYTESGDKDEIDQERPRFTQRKV